MRMVNDASVQKSVSFSDESPRSRAEQSRINGALSHGPKTEGGKSTSRANSLKHGLTARAVLLPGEDPAAFETFVDDLNVELKPSGTLQQTLVLRAAETAWKLRRFPSIEGAVLLDCQQRQAESSTSNTDDGNGVGALLHHLVGENSDGILLRLQRYETRLERSLQACLRELRMLQDREEARDAAHGDVREPAPQRAAAPKHDRASGSFCSGAEMDSAHQKGTRTIRTEDADPQPDTSGSFCKNGSNAAPAPEATSGSRLESLHANDDAASGPILPITSGNDADAGRRAEIEAMLRANPLNAGASEPSTRCAVRG